MPMFQRSQQQPQWHLLPLVGFSENDIQQKSAALNRYLQQHPQVSLNQVAANLVEEETKGTFRKAFVANNSSHLINQLAANNLKEIACNSSYQEPAVIFMFPGIGDHYLQMGRGIYEAIPYFRKVIEQCDVELRPFLTKSITEHLYPPEQADTITTGMDLAAMLGRKQTSSTPDNSPKAQMQKTVIAHPLVFCIEYALAKLLQHWGIQPQGLIGYSLGEYVAATIAGVFTLKDALTLVTQRARLIQSLPTGKMLAVPLSQEAVQPFLNQQVSLSAHNAESLTILAGEPEAIHRVQCQLIDQQIACQILDTTHAFHSHMMQAAAAELTEIARTIPYSPPQIPYLSNVTGTWITPQQAVDPTYWVQHMCQPVQCFSMLHHLLRNTQTYQLIEVGPGQSLGSFVKQHPQCKRDQYAHIHGTLRYSYDQQDDHWFLLSTLRKLWLTGIDLNWKMILSDYPNVMSGITEQALTFEAAQVKSQKIAAQKDRGEKRRKNRLRHRRNKTAKG